MQHSGMVFGESLVPVRTLKRDALVDLQLGTHLSDGCGLFGYLLVEFYHLLLQVIEPLFLFFIPVLQFIQLTLVEVHSVSCVLQLAPVLTMYEFHSELDELQTSYSPQDRYYRGDYNGE